MLVTQRAAAMRSTVQFGFGKFRAKIIRVSIYLRIPAGIDR